jgi:hypothetical protein
MAPADDFVVDAALQSKTIASTSDSMGLRPVEPRPITDLTIASPGSLPDFGPFLGWACFPGFAHPIEWFIDGLPGVFYARDILHKHGFMLEGLHNLTPTSVRTGENRMRRRTI